jgi:hypothetical protein
VEGSCEHGNEHCLFLLPSIMQKFFYTIHTLFTKMLVKIHMSLKYIYNMFDLTGSSSGNIIFLLCKGSIIIILMTCEF